MLKSKPFVVFVSLLLVTSLACAGNVPVSDPNAVSTQVALTIFSGLTQTISPSMPATLVPGASTTPIIVPTDTLTPTITLSPTPLFTATPTMPMITVSVPTNCRVGPGKVYDRVGALLVGETAQVFGRDPSGNYWYIQNPDNPSGFCWLWGEYGTVTGNFIVLPIFTPPPTPTFTPSPTPEPTFKASYSGKDTCVGWWLEFSLENKGTVAFTSMSLSVEDTVTTTVVSVNTEDFTNINGCLTTTTKDSLASGVTLIVSSPAFAYDPTGHLMKASIRLCTQPGLTGTCVKRNVDFTP